MSQPTSSIVSHDNPEIKYKKALKEISKLIQANRTLRESSEKIARELNQKINELSLRYEDLVREYESVRKEKQSLSNYLDQIQQNDNQFRKERNNLDREVAYLNDIVQENSAELKKIKMHKDERAVANLIRTYEQKQITMNRNRAQNEEIITSLKSAYERLDNEFQTERNEKQQYEDRCKVLSLEMNRYKEQNASLLEQIERLLRESYQKDSYCTEKQKQLRLLVSQFQKQVSILKAGQEQSYRASKDNSFQNQIEELQAQKNKVQIEFKRLQNAYQELIVREKQYYDMEEKMKHAKLQAERANDQINMLKSKIIVLEAKDFLEEAGDQDYDQKQFEEKLNSLVSQNDPIHTIRNQQDSSHFKILKGFIVDLQDKVIKLTTQREQMRKKYKSMKTKFVKNAQQADYYEEQNKLMKTKLQGYEKLSQKLQYELQNSISAHEEGIARMTATSNNIITKRVQQYKATIAVLSSQLQMSQGKFDRSQKNLKQEIETLKLQLDTYKMKFNQESDKSSKDNELLNLYKNKNIEISTRINVLQELLSNNNENLNRFEQLYKEQKGKNQALQVQKQQLILQVKQFGDLAGITAGMRQQKSKNVRFSHEFDALRTGKSIQQELISQNRRMESWKTVSESKQLDVVAMTTKIQ